MKLFLDTANLNEIEKTLKLGIISGITTNPGLIAKEPKTDYIAHLKKIAELCQKYRQEVPLSMMVVEKEPEKMLVQAKEFSAALQYGNLNIKIPVGLDTLWVVRELEKNNIKVNYTCGMNEAQTILGGLAGATYFSIFHGHIKDLGSDPNEVIKNSRQLLEGTKTEIISGGVRHMKDAVDSFLAGAHIVTVPYEILEKMAIHPKTVENINRFIDKFNQWGQQ